MKLIPLLVFAFAPAAAAQIVYDNGGPNLVNGYHSDFDSSSPSDTGQVGDDFVLAAAASFDEAKFWGAYAFDNVPPAADDFTLRVFDLASPPPVNPPVAERSLGAAVRVNTGSTILGFLVYEHTASFASISLPAGTYLLSIVNDTTGTVSDWFWCTTNNPINSWQRPNDAQPWLQHGWATSAFVLSASADPITSACFGDGSGTVACPCANEGGAGTGGGCANGAPMPAGQGAVLSASGSNSIAADDLVLTADFTTNQPGLFFQGENSINGGNGSPFGDGLRCCGQNVIRLEIADPTGPSGPHTTSTAAAILGTSPAGTTTAGDTRCYQWWYRNPGTSLCGSNFNLSNSALVTWAP